MAEKTVVLTIGDNAPEFSTADFKGHAIILSAARVEGPAVLIFLRGFG
jgi:peroxiredoxin